MFTHSVYLIFSTVFMIQKLSFPFYQPSILSLDQMTFFSFSCLLPISSYVIERAYQEQSVRDLLTA